MPDAVVTVLSPIMYIILAGFYTLHFCKKDSYFKPFVKILPHILVVCSVMYIFATTSPPFPAISAFYLLKLNSLLYVYLFTMIADIIFTFHSFFFYGVIYSCISQWYMAFMFSEGGSMFVKMTRMEIFSIGLIGSISLFFYLYMLPKMEIHVAIPEFVYLALLSANIWSASLHFQRMFTLCIFGANLGVVLLSVYSALVATDRWRKPIVDGEKRMMTIYYTAMFLISYSTIFAENEPTFHDDPNLLIPHAKIISKESQ